ncbi:hypothetical protein BV25DRAFT_1842130 [Artomyces pyxidatus]|uniref:Uncharacterized protein n=1 Tax=Artomyces pyxidatus TaxID=48021 RepID=A0ACB8SJW0_9AGAM|nr:hypothetical protein BV25DRAFT_1842130 [Artomyces pyxidatus]
MLSEQLSRTPLHPLVLCFEFPDRGVHASNSHSTLLRAALAALENALSRVTYVIVLSHDRSPAHRILSALIQKHESMPSLVDFVAFVNPDRASPRSRRKGPRSSPLLDLPEWGPADTSLQGIPLHWTRARFPGLTHLTLRFLEDDLKPRIDDLRAALSSCQETLLSLELHGAIQLVRAPAAPDASSDPLAFWSSEFLELDGGSNPAELSGEVAELSGIALENASTLENQAEATGFVAPTFNEDSAVVFPQLVELRLGFTHPLEAIALVKLVRAPKLRRFHFCDARNMNPRVPIDSNPYYCNIALHDLLVRATLPFAQLEHLQLEGIHYICPLGLGVFLYHQCTHLRSLCLDRCTHLFSAPLVRSTSFSEDLETWMYGITSDVLECIHVRGIDLLTLISPFQAYAEVSVEAGLEIVRIRKLIFDYEVNRSGETLQQLLDNYPALAQDVYARHFPPAADDEDFVEQQKRELGLSEGADVAMLQTQICIYYPVLVCLHC